MLFSLFLALHRDSRSLFHHRFECGTGWDFGTVRSAVSIRVDARVETL